MIFGVGVNDLKGMTGEEFYKVWHSMLRRAYSAVYHLNKPTYVGVEVCDQWHRLSVFKRWFDDNYVDGFQLDKDILVKGSKLYSPDTCCFVPREINSALISKQSKTDLPIGVYYKKANNKYCAQMSCSNNYDRYGGYLGLFDSPEDAFMAYKVAKEAYIKSLAEKYKADIRTNVYEALINWNIEITD